MRDILEEICNLVFRIAKRFLEAKAHLFLVDAGDINFLSILKQSHILDRVCVTLITREVKDRFAFENIIAHQKIRNYVIDLLHLILFTLVNQERHVFVAGNRTRK